MSKATLSEEKRATATANIQKTLVKFDRVFFELCELTDRQTDRQTDKQTNRHTVTHHDAFCYFAPAWVRSIMLRTPAGAK